MSDTLLQRAQRNGTHWNRTVITAEHIELALAWANGKVGITQVARALGHPRPHANTYMVLALALREAVRRHK